MPNQWNFIALTRFPMSQNMVKRRPAEPLFILLENYRAPRLTAGALFLSIADAERSKMTIFALTISLTFEICLDDLSNF